MSDFVVGFFLPVRGTITKVVQQETRVVGLEAVWVFSTSSWYHYQVVQQETRVVGLEAVWVFSTSSWYHYQVVQQETCVGLEAVRSKLQGLSTL